MKMDLASLSTLLVVCICYGETSGLFDNLDHEMS